MQGLNTAGKFQLKILIRLISLFFTTIQLTNLGENFVLIYMQLIPLYFWLLKQVKPLILNSSYRFILLLISDRISQTSSRLYP